ncbi:hypothetical protein Ocin01_09071, partial [Orchesella cincta]
QTQIFIMKLTIFTLITTLGIIMLTMYVTPTHCQGLLCFQCENCKNKPVGDGYCQKNGTELDRCGKLVFKDGTINRVCANKSWVDEVQGAGASCEQFKELELFDNANLKACYCDGDLCNEAAIVNKVTKRRLLLSVFAAVSIYLAGSDFCE